MKRMLSLIAILLVVIMTLTACSSTTGTTGPGTSDPNTGSLAWDAAPAEGVGTYRSTYLTEATIFNNLNYTNSESTMNKFLANLYEFVPSDDRTTYKALPAAAEAFPIDVNGDGKTWDIKVRDNLKWANGDPLTAEDYVYTYKQLFDPLQLNMKALSGSKYFPIVNSEDYYYGNVDWDEVGIHIVDGNTLRFEIDVRVLPTAIVEYFTSAYTGPVYEPMYEELMSEDRTETMYGTQVDRLMCSGEYVLTEWIRDGNRTFVKNPDYPLANYYWWSKLEEKFVPDANTSLQLFENGETDSVSLGSDALEKYGEDPRIKNTSSTAVSYWCMNLANEDMPILDNVNFRLALFYAVDRATIADIIRAVPTNYYLSPVGIGNPETGEYYRNTEQGKSVPTENLGYDPDLAREYFAKALEEEGITEKLVFEIRAAESSDQRVETAEQLQKHVPKVLGEDKIEFTITQLPNKVISDAMRSRDYETALGGYSQSVTQPWSSLMMWTSEYGGNSYDEAGNVTVYGKRKHTPWYNEEFDAGFQELMFGETVFDTTARLDLMAELEALVLSETPAIPIYCKQSYILYSSDVEVALTQYSPLLRYGIEFSRPIGQ